MHFASFLGNGNLLRIEIEAPIHRRIGISCQTFAGDTFQQMVAADTSGNMTDGNRRQGFHNKVWLLLFKKVNRKFWIHLIFSATIVLENIYVVVEEVFANRDSAQQVMRSPCYQWVALSDWNKLCSPALGCWCWPSQWTGKRRNNCKTAMKWTFSLPVEFWFVTRQCTSFYLVLLVHSWVQFWSGLYTVCSQGCSAHAAYLVYHFN